MNPPDAPERQCTVVVRGRVQGVGFREACVREARALGVAGWVRNRVDGTVEALLQGAPAAVERLVDWLRRGPPAARVEGVDVAPSSGPAARLEGFERRPSA